MMTESNARWAMYEMTIEQIGVLIAGVECMYSQAAVSLYETVAAKGIDAVSAEYEKLAMAHDLLEQLRAIHGAIVAADEAKAECAADTHSEC